VLTPVLLLLLLLQALNEFDLRATDWRKKLESQRGAVLAFETKVGDVPQEAGAVEKAHACA
jgi:hypothetical protein